MGDDDSGNALADFVSLTLGLGFFSTFVFGVVWSAPTEDSAGWEPFIPNLMQSAALVWGTVAVVFGAVFIYYASHVLVEYLTEDLAADVRGWFDE